MPTNSKPVLVVSLRNMFLTDLRKDGQEERGRQTMIGECDCIQSKLCMSRKHRTRLTFFRLREYFASVKPSITEDLRRF
jgi:hypothetical protein